MKAALYAAKQDWQVWAIWYDDRLASNPMDEERELAYVRIEEALWDQGPAIVNAEIRKRIEELEPPPPLAGAAAQHHPEIIAAWQSGDAAPQTPPAPIEAIPEQEPLATRFCVNSEGLIDVVPDPPAPETAADLLQREFYEEIRLKAQSLVAVGPNQLGNLSGPANRFCDGLKDRIEDISITSLWSRGNTLRIRLNAHDLSTGNEEPDPGRLHPLVAETLRDLVHTWNIFIVGDRKGRELDEMRLGPQDVEAAKRVVAAAVPIVEAIEHSEMSRRWRRKRPLPNRPRPRQPRPPGSMATKPSTYHERRPAISWSKRYATLMRPSVMSCHSRGKSIVRAFIVQPGQPHLMQSRSAPV